MAHLHHSKRATGVILLVVVASVLAAPVNAQQTAQERANVAAYQAAIKCFVANGHARGNRRDAGDEAGAVRYESQARRSFDAAVLLGTAIGYSNERMNGDLATTMDRELLRMFQDTAYFRQTVADCRALGLM